LSWPLVGSGPYGFGAGCANATAVITERHKSRFNFFTGEIDC